ncbi:unnamed protein product [Kuraishia capsulata CBS 1993]|uniref:Mitochondrial adapter protein MCP1 transmembrane domain-containing protein n=1 Tax=Kuraishia capsulata CBS 1993 TaxID=1382522 RepID=W6MPW4_9ASCO|nr:uncharacterized protein KUCA_T00004360001 [Kuraishia capsulata CBS 1993]CDK28378.1 unnamed protein product [Kuraishia capsulata CBS 1993]
MTSELKELLPEPVEIDESEILPPPKKWSIATWVIPHLVSIQKYSVIPFTVFSALHLSSTIFVPAVAGPGAGEDVFTMARTIYQAPGIEETMVLGAAGTHVLSGVLLRICRKIKHDSEYGKQKRRSKAYMTEAEKAKDADFGLGGFFSLFGFGSKQSVVSKKFGISPSVFSGYLLTVLLTCHVASLRLAPLLVDGDSSYVSLAYISHIFNRSPIFTSGALGLLTAVGTYHMSSGWLRILHKFSLNWKRAAYGSIALTCALLSVALSKVGSLGLQTGFMAAKFDAYHDYFH